jgi:hypothetical protein
MGTGIVCVIGIWLVVDDGCEAVIIDDTTDAGWTITEPLVDAI